MAGVALVEETTNAARIGDHMEGRFDGLEKVIRIKSFPGSDTICKECSEEYPGNKALPVPAPGL